MYNEISKKLTKGLKKSESGLTVPAAFKGKTRKMTVQFACLFALKIADDFIQCKTGKESNSIAAYILFMNRICEEKWKEIRDKAKDGKWSVNFGIEDKYDLAGQKAIIAVGDATEKLVASNKFIKALVRTFWDSHGSETDNLKYFIDWIPKYSKGK
jgi:hypothetical protein